MYTPTVRLAILVAGATYSCQEVWKELSCIVKKTGARLFTSLGDDKRDKEYAAYVGPSSAIYLSKKALHAGIRQHIPWIHETESNMTFLNDERCCHAPYILFRRFVLRNMIEDFTNVLVVRPDSLSSLDCNKTAELLMRNIRGIEYRPAHSDAHNGHACPQSISDQWFFGDAGSVRMLLESFPNLSTWHKTWEADPHFDKWWLKHNKISKGRFFLNTEGIYGKMLQNLNITCTKSKKLNFKIRKVC